MHSPATTRCFFVIFAILHTISVYKINALEIDKLPLELLENANECLDPAQENREISCKFYGASEEGPDPLSVRCLRRGALIVQGNLLALKIFCSSQKAIDFFYDGVQPTEALIPLYSKAISSNINHLPLNSSLSEYFPDGNSNYEYNAEVTILGVNAQHQYYRNSANFKEESGGVDYIRYPSTGRYTFQGLNSKQVKYEFYLFVEDDKSKPQFLRGSTTESIFYRSGQIRIPCRPSHHKANVTLTKAKKVGNDSIVVYTTDAVNGIALNATGVNQTTAVEYVCEMKYGNVSDSLKFQFPPNVSKAKVNYGFQEMPKKDSFSSKVSIALDPSTESDGNTSRVSVTCHGQDDARKDSLYLATIPCRNAMHCRLVREFVLKKFSNQSYSAAVVVGRSHVQLDVAHTFTYGISLCQSRQYYTAKEYSINLNRKEVLREYKSDWIRTSGRSTARANRFLRIDFYNTTRSPSQPVYVKKEETFACQIFLPVFVKPVIWMIKMKNGSVFIEKISHDFSGDTALATITIRPGTQAILCAASYHYENTWRNNSLHLHVHNGSPPKISDEHMSDNFRFKYGTHSHLIRCQAKGDPLPDLTWEKDGKIIAENKKSSFLLLEVSEVTSDTAGVYVCTARNHLNYTTYSVNVEVEYEESNYGIMVGLPMVAIIITTSVFIVYMRFFRKEKAGLTKEEYMAFLNGEENLLNTPATDTGGRFVHEYSHNMAYDVNFEVPAARFEVDLKNILGAGEYGLVIRGKVFGRDVAVKTVKRTTSKAYLQALLSELKIMIHIEKHESIVELVGAFTSQLDRGDIYVFVELCGRGNANNFLRANRHKFVSGWDRVTNFDFGNLTNIEHDKFNLDSTTLMKWALDVANAMQYLHSKKVIHGDLAARNVLLTTDLCVKLTDFGLSRQLHNYSMYVKKHQEPLPWRWMALESLKDLSFSNHSDVWAYGVLLWEFFSLAEVPYPGYSFSLDFVTLLSQGMRMICPKYASNYLYNAIMLECWKEEPKDRPSFTTIVSMLQNCVGYNGN